MPWAGEWPGVQECREFEFVAIRNPDGPGYPHRPTRVSRRT